MGFGGPHAGYMATKNKYVRKLPGRIVGVSKDSEGMWVIVWRFRHGSSILSAIRRRVIFVLLRFCLR